MFDTSERYSFLGHPVPEALAARLADRLVLRDNRDGTRVGFPFTVIDEILTLSAILEEDLGPMPRSTDNLKTRR